MAYAGDLKSPGRKAVWVRLPPRVPISQTASAFWVLEDLRHRLRHFVTYLILSSMQVTFSSDTLAFLRNRIGSAQLSNLIARFETDVPAVLRTQMLSYFHTQDFAGKRLLDFGCGYGASALCLAQMFPETEIVGVELSAERIEIAQKIADAEKISNVRFLCSPSGDKLPPGIGQFDFVVLSAVYEHLLPSERKIVMPLLWSVMNGGVIFISQTPYRYFPFEHHSTGLWFINYMPDRVAHFVARKFSKHDPTKYDRAIQTSTNFEDHLRGGLRGGTEWEMIRDLILGRRRDARILQPLPECARNRADYWLRRTRQGRFRLVKMAAAWAFSITDRLFGTVPSMNVDVVISKKI